MKKKIDWLQVLAVTSTVVGIAALLGSEVWAQDQKNDTNKGFQPGSKPFSNPFAGKGPAPGFFEDEMEEDEEDLDMPEGNFRRGAPPAPQTPQAPQNNARSAPATGAPGTPGDPPNPVRDAKGISIGGTPPGGVIAKTDPGVISVDDETGAGGKEIVTDFNFPDADIIDIAKTLGKLTGKNFIVDKDVKGRITVISNSPITVSDAWRAFLTALDVNGFALIPSGAYIRIARQRDARDKQLKTYTGDYSPDTDALITRVFPLKYISAEEVARTFRNFMPANARIIPYEQTNTVIVTDTGANISKLAKMLEILDVEGYDAGIEVIPVKFASAEDLSKLIDTLIPGTTSGAAPGGGAAPRFGGGKFAARRTKEGGIINTIIADGRTNNLIVHANSRGAEQVRELVAKLDQKIPVQNVGAGRVHVVYLQFAESEAIANTLNNLTSQAGGGPRPPSGGGGGTGVNPNAQSLFEGNIKVSPDKSTNSLVITASPTDFVTVQRVINRLDIPRDQVYVEAVIMEVSVDKGFDFSASAALPSSGIAFLPNQDLLGFLTSPLAATGAIIGFKSGKTTEMTINNQKVQVPNAAALVKAIQTHSNANVLATPQILTLDNTQATFETSEKIPVLTQTAIQGGGVAQSTTKENVSLSITIKPQMNKVSNLIKLDIETKLADITNRPVPRQVEGLAFATLERNAKTSVVVADEDTVVMGGLVRDKTTESVSKIPLLGDIPLLGWLFKSKVTSSSKTNLLIFITPHIVRQYDKVRAILDKKLRERDDFLEQTTGGDDPLRRKRDDIIRSLPDVDKLSAYRPKTSTSIDEEETPAAVEVPPTNGGSLGGGSSSPSDDAPVGSIAPPELQAEPQAEAPPPPPPAEPLQPQPEAHNDSPPAAEPPPSAQEP